MQDAANASAVRNALTRARSGASEDLDALADALYPELKRIARAQLRRLRPGHTLDTTGLVHETYVKMVGFDDFVDRSHFLAASARAMRHILINTARRKLTDKRGGGVQPVTLDGREAAADHDPFVEILSIGQALERLHALDERLCRVVECRFYAGMTEDETAVALDVSARTVRRDWLRARAWLKDALGMVPDAGEKDPE